MILVFLGKERFHSSSIRVFTDSRATIFAIAGGADPNQELF
jgi:hypothetical protein